MGNLVNLVLREREIMTELGAALMEAALRQSEGPPGPNEFLRAAVDTAHRQLAEADVRFAPPIPLRQRSTKPNPIGPGYSLGPPNRPRKP
jgi:hypothetical protein